MSIVKPVSVLVFDSGVGGLSILRPIQQQLPTVQTHYVMDDAWCPYGHRNEAELVSRILAVVEAAVENCRPDLLVVACNTASTLALTELRQRLSIPVVGVVPALKPAAEESCAAGAVMLLATAATVNGDYVASLWRQFGGQRSLVTMACPELVALAESKLRGEPVSARELNAWCARVQQRLQASGETSVATFVLGCTHFPLLRDELMSVWTETAQWLDSGEAVARRVKSLLCERAPYLEKPSPAEISKAKQSGGAVGFWWRTDASDHCQGIVQAMPDYGLSAAGCLKLEACASD